MPAIRSVSRYWITSSFQRTATSVLGIIVCYDYIVKRFILFFVCILLCGCAPVNDLNASLDEAFSFEMSQDKIRRNNYSRYIDYYLPSDTSEFEGSDLSGCFVYGRSRFIMDVNVSGIINDKYREMLDRYGLAWEDGGHTPERIINADEIIKRKDNYASKRNGQGTDDDS